MKKYPDSLADLRNMFVKYDYAGTKSRPEYEAEFDRIVNKEIRKAKRDLLKQVITEMDKNLLPDHYISRNKIIADLEEMSVRLTK